MTTETRLISIFGTENESRIADIVFVHGLNGDPLSTWHPQGKPEKTNSWMSWLGEDLEGVGIWSIGYEAKPFRIQGDTLPLVERATDIVELLNENELGERPLIFITHSLGGLVVKQLLRNACDYGNPSWKRILDQTKGIVYLSTPHSGSDIAVANWLKFCGGLLGKSETVRELESNDSRLLELLEVHRNHELLSQIPVKVYYETKPTYGVIVVDRTSANPGIAKANPIPVERDHIFVAKPESREDRPYKGVRGFIKEQLRQPLPPLKTSESTPQSEREIKVENGNYNENIEGNYIRVEGKYIQNPEAKKKD